MPARQRSLDWVPCPKCGSGKTLRFGRGLMGFASLVMGSCMLWIPVVGWVLAPVFFLVAVGLWISAAVPSAKVTFQCQSCKQWFSIPKSDLRAADSGADVHGDTVARRIPTWVGALILIGIASAILLIPAAEGPPSAPDPGPSATDASFERIGGQGMVDFVIATAELSSNRAALENRMRNFCDKQRDQFCQVMVWTNRAHAARALPMTDAQLNAQFAQYNRNRSTGYDCFMLLRRGEPRFSSSGC